MSLIIPKFRLIEDDDIPCCLFYLSVEVSLHYSISTEREKYIYKEIKKSRDGRDNSVFRYTATL